MKNASFHEDQSNSPKRALARDLALRLAIALTIIIAALGSAYFFITVTQAQRDLSLQATHRVEELADVLSIPVWNLDKNSIEQISLAYLNAENVVGLRVLGDTGNPIYEVLTDEGGLIVETRPIEYNGQKVGAVEISVSTSQIAKLRSDIFLLMLTIVIVVVITIVVATWFLLQRFLSLPLETLTKGIESFAGGDYSQRLKPLEQKELNIISEQFNAMANQIQARDQFLEQRVADRTRDLNIASDVSRQITRVLDMDELLHQLVNQTKDGFNLYAASVYIYQPVSRELTLEATTGTTGRQMEKAVTTISIDIKPSLMAQAAREQNLVVMNDVSLSKDYLVDPSLPDAKSEAVFPMIAGTHLIGVLDLLSEKAGRFGEADIQILNTLAEQIGIAVRNAQLYADTQHDLEERKRSENRLRQQNEYLLAVQETTLGLLSRHTLKELLENILQRAAALVGTPHGNISLLEPDSRRMRVRFAIGLEEQFNGDYTDYGEGLTGKVWESAAPLVVNDYRIWAGRKPEASYDLFRATMGVPLQFDNKVAGVLCLDYDDERIFGEESVAALQQFAQLATVALNNAQLLEDTDQRLRELEALHESSLSLISNLDLSAVLNDILQSAFKLAQTTRDAYIYYYQPAAGDQEDHLTFLSALWFDGRDVPLTDPVPGGVAYQTARGGERIVIPNMRTHPLYAPVLNLPDWQEYINGAVVYLPLKIGANVVGVMLVGYQRPRDFSDTDLRPLRLLGDQAAIAIENARLFKAERQHADELSILLEATRAVSSSLELEKVLTLISEQLTRALRASGCVISGWEPEEDSVVTWMQWPATEASQWSAPVGARFSLKEYENTRRVLEQRRPYLVRVADPKADPVEVGFLRQIKQANCLILPLAVGERVLGIVELYDAAPEREFTPAEIQFCQALADQIGIAVLNAQLYSVQIQASAELRRADAMKSQFLSSVSHELRTPLNAIINLVEMVARGMVGSVTGEQKELLDQSLLSSHHLLQLINDVLDISKIQAGQLKLFVEDNVNLNNELDTVIIMVKPLLEKKPIEMILDIDPNLPIISGDRRRLRQILINLLSNAIKFTDEGTVTLSAKNQEDHIKFSVIDTGYGVPVESQSAIFEPFVQSSDGVKQEGTGLGLPISRSLVQAHGGDLWMESEVGRGTAFHFIIPIKNNN